MNGPHPFLLLGSVYAPAYANEYYTLTDLPQAFDVIISIQKVTASQLIPLKDQAAAT
jgi:erythromycin esterase-like protein